MEMLICNGSIHINEIRNNAGMSQGKNIANGWSYYSKTNSAIGQIAGNRNTLPTGLNFLNDCDYFDTIMTNAGGNSSTSGSIIETGREEDVLVDSNLHGAPFKNV
ncbi:hypothetical protein DCCM_0232 [Desulfocucumis palustris]|uniref:Uncharacterized protein n=1 Tax=Desulfocucumis palustris TaxID=1898651 RepID=A0A2L2XDY8_9FIRM|nr:hypothetical protein [Desulfocucumis palustris]GBF32041.1 hypothetical protein DCCM_0232 [Desulfocucumis palustris]